MTPASRGSTANLLADYDHGVRPAVTVICMFRIVGVSAYSPDVSQKIAAANPQILLLDSNGLSVANATLLTTIRATKPSVRIVLVDMDADEHTFLRAVRAGVVGYVLKDASALEIASTISAVVAGEAVCPRGLSMTLFRSVAQQWAVPPGVPSGAELGLSRREQQMVELLRERLTNKEIAGRLNLSEQTVKNHVHHILRKLGAQNRTAIVERCQNNLRGLS